MYVSPTVVGDLVYAASCSGKLFALDRHRGEVRWSFDTGATFHGEPVVTDKLLVIPSDAGFVYAFELGTGEVRWKTPLPPAGVLSDLVRVGPTVVGLDSLGQLFSLDLATGGLQWLFPPEGTSEERQRVQPPAAAGERVFFAGSRGDVYCVDAFSGEEIWRRELGAPVTTAVVLAGDAVVVGTEDRRLARLSLADGEVLSRIELPEQPAGTPAAAPGAVVLLAGSSLLAAVDPDLKSIRWTLPSVAGFSSPRPLLAGDTVLAGTEEGEVMAARLADGSVVWRATGSGVVRGLGASAGTYFIGTLAGTVYAYEPPVTQEVEQALVRGRAALEGRSRVDLQEAIRQFEGAVALAPNHAPAHAGLAAAWALLADYPKAEEAARRALELDDGLAQAHAVLAFTRLHGAWDWAGAELGFRRALELDPRYAQGHAWYAILLEALGETNRAVEEARTARQLDPANPVYAVGLAFRLFWARRYTEAVQELQAVLEKEPAHPQALYFLGRAYVQQRRFAEARAILERALSLLRPDDLNPLSAMAYLDALTGRRRQARAVIEKLEGHARRGYPFASQIAGIYAALGEKGAALDWLETAVQAREGPLVWLKVDPRFDPLRGEPRFAALLGAMHFPG